MGRSSVVSWLGGAQMIGGRRCSYSNQSNDPFDIWDLGMEADRLVRSRHIVADLACHSSIMSVCCGLS